MKKPYYNWFASDFLGSPFVQSLSWLDEFCYRRLLDMQATSDDKRISGDIDKMRAQCKNLPAAQFRKVWETIKVKFTAHPDGAGGLVNLRLHEILAKRDDFLADRSANGILGNQIKTAKRIAERAALQTLSDAKDIRYDHASISIPISKGEKSKKNSPIPPLAISSPSEPKYTPEFVAFWLVSTQRGSKLSAAKAWAKLCPDLALVLKIYESHEAWKRSEQWQDETKQPHVSTWLNRRGWEEIVPKSTNGNGHYPGKIDRRVREPHKPHWCAYCEVPHEHPCPPGFEAVCNWQHEIACPEFAEKYNR